MLSYYFVTEFVKLISVLTEENLGKKALLDEKKRIILEKVGRQRGV